MEQLQAQVTKHSERLGTHDTEIALLKEAVADIHRKLRDLDYPPRWVQTTLLIALVVKEIVWPLIAAARGG